MFRMVSHFANRYVQFGSNTIEKKANDANINARNEDVINSYTADGKVVSMMYNMAVSPYTMEQE